MCSPTTDGRPRRPRDRRSSSWCWWARCPSCWSGSNPTGSWSTGCCWRRPGCCARPRWRPGTRPCLASCCRRSGCVPLQLVSDLPLEDLARGVARQRRYEANFPGQLEAGQLAASEVQQLRGCRRLLAGHYDSNHLFAPLLIWHTHDRYVRYGRVLVENLLDLARVDVDAAGDDQVAHPVHDVDVVVLVQHGDIAGADEAVLAGGLAGRLRVVQITSEDHGRAAPELPRLSDGHRLTLCVEHTDLRHEPGWAHAALFAQLV